MFDSRWRPPVLHTSRLILRPFEPADAPELFSLAANPRVARFTLWDAHGSLEDSRQFIEGYAFSRYLEGVPEPLAIRDRAGALCGCLGCFWHAHAHQSMELGYWIGEPFWGRGLAVEAARALLRHVFATYEVERVFARVIVGNAASERVLEKLHFTREGTLRHALKLRGRFVDVAYHALLRGEFPA